MRSWHRDAFPQQSTPDFYTDSNTGFGNTSIARDYKDMLQEIGGVSDIGNISSAKYYIHDSVGGIRPDISTIDSNYSIHSQDLLSDNDSFFYRTLPRQDTNSTTGDDLFRFIDVVLLGSSTSINRGNKTLSL